MVAAIGHIGMGAQRWLDLELFRFQPSELMKLAVPMMCAWYLHERPLPPSWPSLLVLAGSSSCRWDWSPCSRTWAPPR